MATLSEVYFLVRVGTWDEDDLEGWVQDRMGEVCDDHYDAGYAKGHLEGHAEGQEDMQKEAINALKGLL